MHRAVYGTVVLLVGLSALSLRAQPPLQNPTVLNQLNGLPSNRIRDIARDEHGFVWIATDAGLCRYDGHRLDIIDRVPNDSSIAYTRNVSDICIDRRTGILYLATNLGLQVYDPVHNRFKTYQPDPNSKKGLRQLYVNFVYQDRNDHIWVGNFTEGIAQFFPDRDSFAYVRPSESLASRDFTSEQIAELDHLQAMLQDVNDANIYWMTSRQGIIRWDRAANSMQLFSAAGPGEDTQAANSSLSFYQHYNGLLVQGLWFGDFNVFDPRTRTFSRYTLTDQPNRSTNPLVYQIQAFSGDRIWLSVWPNQLVEFDLVQRRTVRQWIGNSRKALHYGVRLRDPSGIIWAGLDRGLYLYHPLAQRLRHATVPVLEADAQYVPNAIGELEDGRLLFCTRTAEGLYIFDNNIALQHTLADPLAEGGTFKGEGLARTAGGEWLVLTADHLLVLDPVRPALRPFQPRGPWREPDFSDVFVDSRGRIWLSTINEGLYRYDPQRKQWRHFQRELQPPGFPRHFVWLWGLTEDRLGQIWFRAASGYSVYQSERDTFLNFPYREGADNNFSGIVDLALDRNDRLWVAAGEEGLGMIDIKQPERGIQYRFSRPKTLDIIPVDVLESDEQGRIWMANAKGLARLDPERLTFEYYDHNHGLPDYDEELGLSSMTDVILQRLSGGRMSLGYRRGMAVFHPDSLLRNQQLPRPYVAAFRIMENDYPLDSALFVKREIQLSHRDNFFTFELSAINYTAPTQTRFRYRLVGYDDEWVEVDQRRYAAYTKVPSGRYTFELMAANSEGKWNPEPYRLHLIVATPWWRTTAFYLLLLGLLVLLGYRIYRSRIKSVRAKQRERAEFERRLANVEMNALRAQMNPHFIFNCLNSIDSFIIDNETAKASEYLNDFARLIRLILQNSRANYISLRDELEALQLYLQMECLRFDHKFSYDISVTDNIQPDAVNIPPMLIQPYVENAIWHGLMHKRNGEQRRVQIRVRREGNLLHCVVEDNGIGRRRAAEIVARRPAHRQASVGMKITNDRIQMINQLYNTQNSVAITDLVTPDGEPAGTRVELTIPI